MTRTATAVATAAKHVEGILPIRNILLRELPPDELARLMPLLVRVPLKPRRVIHYDNTPMEHAYFIEEGLISVMANAGDGKSVEARLIGREGVVNLPVALGDPIAPHRRVVQVGGCALRMRADDMQMAMRELEAFRTRLLQYVRTVLIQTWQLSACHAAHGMQQRLARWLLTAHDRCRTDDLPLTHQMLSRMLGVRRATVSECMLALEQSGAVDKARSLIRIRDRVRLEEAACNCYGIIRDADRQLKPQCRARAMSSIN